MNTGKNNLTNENDLDELVRSSFGLSDEQLLEDLQKAEQTIDDSQIPPSPEDGFQQILNKIEQRNIKSYRETHPSEPINLSDKKPAKKHWLFSKRVRVLLTAAILLSVLMAANITVSGKRNYEYMRSERDSGKDDIAFDNDENKQEISELEKAYEKIHNELGIEVLKLGYIPEDMKLLELTIDKRHATLSFDYCGNIVYLIQDIKTSSSSTNIVSSRSAVKTIENKWIGNDIEVKGEQLESGDIEYSIDIKANNAFYCMEGVMSLEEFSDIVKFLNFE